MTERRRIALNVAATYGRSLYALAVGLFTGRWILMALGETDYGLYGVVGGLMAFVGFLNGLMAQSVSRFYAFSVGQARTAATVEDGVEECRRWFSIAVMIHVALPVALTAGGYPVGVWAIERFLTIPPDRIGACIWVWRFACLGGFVNMVNVPFSAMYNAKQEIAELTVYSFATSTLMLGFTYYMVEHPGVWLAKYALWMCLLSVVPALIIGVRAVVKYPECRFRWAYVWDRGRILQMLDFCGGRFVAAVASLASGEGLAVLVNKYLGPAKNAAMTIGNTIVGHASSLSNSLVGAFSPAITNAAGEGDYVKMRALILRTCRLATAAVMIFAIPLALEIGEVTRIWLKVPPAGTAVIAAFMLADLVVERVSDGLWIGIFAVGRIRAFQLVESVCFMLRLVIAWAMLAIGFDLESVGLAYILSGALQILVKLWFGRSMCGLSPWMWFREVAGPLGLAGCAAVAVGFAPRLLAAASFGRICLTTGLVECTLLPLLWFFVLRQDERLLLVGRLKRCFAKGGGGGMNILYICPDDPRDTSFGGGQRTNFIWEALKSCGTVYTFCPLGGKAPTATDDAELVRRASVDSPNFVFFLMDRLILRLMSGQVRLPFRSARFIRERIGWPDVKFDCVVVRYVRYAALTSAWKLAPRCIVDIDDLPTQACGGMGRFRRWILSAWERYVLRRATLAWFPNEDLIPQISKMCPCRFLPNLARPPKPGYQVSGKQKWQLMSVGWMAYQPNHEGVDWFVREVWPKVHDVHPDLKYVIAGKGAPAECIRRWSAAPGAEVLGFVEDLDSLYEESLAVVAPVFSGSGTCIKVQEAGLRGRLVFATPFAARGIASDVPFLKVSDTAEQMRQDLLSFLGGAGCSPAVCDLAQNRADFGAEVRRGVGML